MENQNSELDKQVFLFINGPLIVLNLTANIFYAWCLVSPPRSKQRLKQPLKTVLGLLVWCSIIYFGSLVVMYAVLKSQHTFELFIMLWVMFLCYVYSSMTCSVMLNVYYYIQIVPSQRALLIWVKRNITPVIYVVLFVDGPLFFISNAVTVAGVTARTSRRLTAINGTWTGYDIDELRFASKICVLIIKVHMVVSLCTMMFSSFSTGHYLHRHIRRMAQGGSCFSTARLRSQMRVTITGISQGVLYLLYGTFYFFNSFTYNSSSHFSVSLWISFTVTSLYVSGTTVNLGVGQTMFRKRAAEVWKALKAQCRVGAVTNDVNMHAS